MLRGLSHSVKKIKLRGRALGKTFASLSALDVPIDLPLEDKAALGSAQGSASSAT
jgi:hypothetical protein